MKRSKRIGSVLSQYGIIIGLVVLAIIPIFIIFGNNIVGYFTQFNELLKSNNTNLSSTSSSNNGNSSNSSSSTGTSTASSTTSNTTSSNTTSSVSAGQLGGTPEKPVSNCVNNSCTIDYGEFILNGVPANLDEYMQSAGASGVTEALAAVLDQLIAQSPEINSSLDINLLKQLAERGHSFANLENNMEEYAQKYLDDPTNITVSSQFISNSTILAQGSDRIFFESILDQINNQLDGSTDQADKNMKEIVNLLTAEIITLADYMTDKGNNVGVALAVNDDVVADLLKPKASLKTDFDSAIICLTGDGTDTGTKCN